VGHCTWEEPCERLAEADNQHEGFVLPVGAQAVVMALGWRKNPQAPREFSNSVGIKFIRIDPGSFRTGRSTYRKVEKPVHDVTLRKAFCPPAAAADPDRDTDRAGNDPDCSIDDIPSLHAAIPVTFPAVSKWLSTDESKDNRVTRTAPMRTRPS
jgi:hypothetical protein